jgi:hypothetical protein
MAAKSVANENIPPPLSHYEDQLIDNNTIVAQNLAQTYNQTYLAAVQTHFQRGSNSHSPSDQKHQNTRQTRESSSNFPLFENFIRTMFRLDGQLATDSAASNSNIHSSAVHPSTIAMQNHQSLNHYNAGDYINNDQMLNQAINNLFFVNDSKTKTINSDTVNRFVESLPHADQKHNTYPCLVCKDDISSKKILILPCCFNTVCKSCLKQALSFSFRCPHCRTSFNNNVNFQY